MNKTLSNKVVLLLAAVFAMTPFAIDSYLPSITSIARDLKVDTAMVSITVSLYVFGLAIGQLIGGPLSDKLGRLKVLVGGLSLFAIGSLFLASVDDISWFWFWRAIQSLGGGIAVVVVPATIRDNATGRDAAKLFSLIALIMMIAPSIAPTVGTLIMNSLGWQWIFRLSALLAFIVAIYAIPTMPKGQVTTAKDSISFFAVFKNKQALGYLISQSFSYTVLMTFITNAPFAYMVHYQVSAEMLSGLFLANVLGVVVINRLNSLLLNRYDPELLLSAFIKLQLAGVLILVSSQLLLPTNLLFAATGFIVTTAAIGGIMANANVSFLKHFGRNAGMASAAVGASQYFLGAGISALAAILSNDSLWPIVIIMLLATVLSLLGSTHANNKNKHQVENFV
ncbi:multidrug effflux MFS transporter [Vibrio sp.]|uniref:multidrug effflux MFS transporter n=1 Tax=Vibrio sp. TaxID=678 RepID=UPI003D1042F4